MTGSRNGRQTKLKERIKSRDAELADPATYQDYARWNDLHREREQWGHELDRLTHKWGDLSAELDSQKISDFVGLKTLLFLKK